MSDLFFHEVGGSPGQVVMAGCRSAYVKEAFSLAGGIVPLLIRQKVIYMYILRLVGI